MKTDVCPVCQGKGTVTAGFYEEGIQGTTFTGTETCKSCDGRGYVYVPEEDEYGIFGLLGSSS